MATNYKSINSIFGQFLRIYACHVGKDLVKACDMFLEILKNVIDSMHTLIRRLYLSWTRGILPYLMELWMGVLTTRGIKKLSIASRPQPSSGVKSENVWFEKMFRHEHLQHGCLCAWKSGGHCKSTARLHLSSIWEYIHIQHRWFMHINITSVTLFSQYHN